MLLRQQPQRPGSCGQVDRKRPGRPGTQAGQGGGRHEAWLSLWGCGERWAFSWQCFLVDLQASACSSQTNHHRLGGGGLGANSHQSLDGLCCSGPGHSAESYKHVMRSHHEGSQNSGCRPFSGTPPERPRGTCTSLLCGPWWVPTGGASRLSVFLTGAPLTGYMSPACVLLPAWS